MIKASLNCVHFSLNTVDLLAEVFTLFSFKTVNFSTSFMLCSKCFLNDFSACESARLHSQQVSAFLKRAVASCQRTSEKASFKTWGIEVYSQQWWSFNAVINSQHLTAPQVSWHPALQDPESGWAAGTKTFNSSMYHNSFFFCF